MNTAEQALPKGAFVNDYRIESILGIGGFGITYRAQDEQLGRVVAIKEYCPETFARRLRDHTTLSPRSKNAARTYEFGMERFLDEARTLARFNHQNIVRINQFMRANGTAYLVMDYEDGVTLDRMFRRLGQLTEKQARGVARHLLKGLREIHARNCLHRDIKPQNVLVRRARSVVLLDFGAARQALGKHAGIDAQTMLTPGYAPMEQYDTSAEQGPHTDFYALGATLYHCLSGTQPAPVSKRLAALEQGAPDPIEVGLRELQESLTERFYRGLHWMLEPRAGKRPTHAQAVLDFLFGEGSVPAPANRRDGAATGERPRLATGQHHAITGSYAALDPDAIPEPVEFPEALLSLCETELAGYVGPIARILVERYAETARTPSELINNLAGEVPEAEDRLSFMRKLEARRGAH